MFSSGLHYDLWGKVLKDLSSSLNFSALLQSHRMRTDNETLKHEIAEMLMKNEAVLIESKVLMAFDC